MVDFSIEESILQKAAESPYGIGVRSGDVEHLRRRLKEALRRCKERGFDAYSSLVFRVHPPYIELFILKPEVAANAEGRIDEDDSLALKEGPRETDSVLRSEG